MFDIHILVSDRADMAEGVGYTVTETLAGKPDATTIVALKDEAVGVWCALSGETGDPVLLAVNVYPTARKEEVA